MKFYNNIRYKQYLIIILIFILFFTYIFPIHCKRKCNKSFNKRSENECLERRVPRVTRIIETAQNLFYTNNSLVIYGDKELELMNKVKNMFILKDNNSNGNSNSNSSSNNNERYEFIEDNKVNNDTDKRIGIELMNIFLNSSEEMLIAIPDIFYGYPPIYYKDKVYWKEKKKIRRLLFKYCDYNKQYYTSQISSPYKYSSDSNCELIEKVYNILRQIWMNKNIIIIKSFKYYNYINYLFNTANNYNIISTPNINSLSIIKEIERTILKEDKDKIIILLTNNPIYVILEDHLVKNGRRVIMLNNIDKDYYKYKCKNKQYLETLTY